MNEKNTEQRNVSRVLQARAKHRKWVATLLALAVIVCAGTFWSLRYTGISATYKKKVLDCHAISGEVSHVHNDDCYLNGELVCPLQEIEPHEHTEACYTAVLFCGLEESAGHVHTDACFVPQMELVCGLEETAGDETHPAHYHTDACYAPVRELICGLEETEGDETHPAHWHTDECYQDVMLQVCGMEEGFGAHYHTEECYSQVLICEKPVLPVHVHGPECFRTEEMTPEEVAAMDASEVKQEGEITPESEEGQPTDQTQPEVTEPGTSGDLIGETTITNTTEGTNTDPSPAPETTQEGGSTPEADTTPADPATDLPMQTEPFSFTSMADNILVNVEAPAEAFPAGTEMKVRAVYDEKVLGEMADAVEGNVVQVQAVDISFWFGGKEIEPMQPIRVVMTPVDVPDFDEQTVVHVDDAGSASVIEQENVAEPEAAFEVDSFSVYGLVYTKIETTVLASDGHNYKITVTAPNDAAFPENAKLWASEIMAGGNAYGINYNEYLARTEYALGWEAGKASYVRLFDIFVGDEYGNKLTLTTPVDVKIELADKEANTESCVVHFGTKTEVMNAETSGQTVSFEANSFSVFAVAETTITKYVLASDGQNYKVSLTYGPEAGIPDGADLAVSEVVSGEATEGMSYEDYVAKAERSLDENVRLTFARFFDITIVANGEAIQPLAPVEVKIELAEVQDQVSEDVKALHFYDDGGIRTIPTSVAEQTVSFNADGFSVYGIVGTETITVPFVASNGRTYEVTVNFNKEMGTPENARLEVVEVGAGNAKYDEYVAQAAEAIHSRTIDLQYVKLLDISILDEYGNKVNLSAPVDVQIKLLDKVQAEDTTQVVHFEGAAETPVVMESTVAGDSVSFSTNSFSIYAVVDSGDTGDNARMKLEFYNGTTLIDSMYVKNSDVLLGDGEREPGTQYIEDIIYDPGAGMVASGKIFKGWIIDKENYTVADAENALTIEDIRQWAADHNITENETVKVYALIYTSMKIDYRDEDNISLGTDNILLPVNETSSSYTVQHAYTPKDDLHNFEGWNVQSGGSNISGYSEGTIYQNGTEITVNGDVTFSVNAPEGHWLVFHEDGGTYIAPQFIKSGKNTVRPTTTMQKVGYTFDDWYADEACTIKFNFGNPITDRTHVYAKWNVNATAPYTVIIWTQNLDGVKWDYVDSFQLNGNTNTAVNSITQRGTGQNAYARINGRNYQYTGFHLDHFDQNVTIQPDGTAVVNVYFTRNSYTFTFRAGRYHQFNWNNGVGTSRDPINIYTVTRLYDQDISDIWSFTGSDGYTYPETNAVTSWMPSGSSTYTARITRMERMPAENITFTLTHTQNTTRNFHYYIETVDGATGSRTYNGRQYDLYTDLPNDFNIVYYNDDFWNLNGFTRQAITKSNANGTQNYTVNLSAGGTIPWDWMQGYYLSLNGSYSGQDNHLYFYYTRNKYPITYMDGSYFTGRGALMEDIPNRGHLNDSEDIYYDASLAEYGPGGSKEYVPTYPNFVFGGWYLDKACTQPFPFDSTNMPEGGITVYAKWTQVEYRVFLHPNAGTDASLTWGSDDQQMNFRVAYGSTISAPQGLRTGYEMVGWFTDPACTTPFDEALVLNDTTVTAAYDKTVDMTDPMDKWGNGATTNADVDRNWITKKFDLYAKWRKVIDGALGIGVVYDANGGKNAPKDTTLYLDTAEATAQTASTPPEGKKFEYWVVQTWDAEQGKYVDTDTKVYPGDTYIVLLDNAKQVISSWENPKDPTDISPTQDATHTKIHDATYTVQLRAEYLDAEQETPTHIDWFANNGTGDSVSDSKDGKLKINEPVDIRAANTFTYPGHKFLGWARMEDDEDGEHPDHPELDEDDLWLIYDEATNSFKVKQEGTTELRTVSQIAADERNPYHDLYAVWEPRTYKVTIEKIVVGEDTNRNFTIYYTFDDTSLTGGNVSLQHDESQELTVDVPYGTTITLSENVTGYEKSYTAVRTTNDEGTALDKPVTISETSVGSGAFVVEGDTTITVTNTRQIGNLEISKVTNPEGLDDTKIYKVSVKNSVGKYLQDTETIAFGDEEKWFDVSVSTKLRIEELPVDTYTVTESEDNTAIEGYRYNGASYSSDNGSIAVVKDETAELTVTNSYTKLADVTVTKILDDKYPQGSESFTFTPVLTENEKDITSQYITDLTDGKFTLTPVEGGGETRKASITFENLPVGAVLNVTETADDKYTTTISVNGSSADTASLTIADPTPEMENESINTIVFTNTRKTWLVDFKKTSVDGTDLSGAEFRLKIHNGNRYVNYQEDNLTLGTASLNLVEGSYELTENKSPDGYIIATNTIRFTVDAEGNVSDPTKEDGTADSNLAVKEDGTSEGSKATIVIKNTPGQALPMTGGMGAELVEAIGGIMMALSFVVMVIRKRRMA